MNNGVYFDAYYKCCDLAKQAVEQGRRKEAAAFYRQAIDYSDKLLRCELDKSTRVLLETRTREIINAIIELEGGDTPAAPAVNNVKGKAAESKTTWFDAQPPELTLADIMGLKNVVRQIDMDIITPLRYPQVYRSYVKRVGSRILMYGAPGTGKTFVVRCLAGELGCKIAIVKTSEILDKYVGEAEKKISEIFKESEQYDRSLIFIDEIDAIASSRDSDDARNTKSILNTLLTEMDGFSTDRDKDKLRIVIAATNMPWALDPAIRRGGRFDVQLYVGLPDRDARYYMIERAFRRSDGSYPPIAGDPIALFGKMADALDKWYGGGDIVAICERICKLGAYKSVQSNKIDPSAGLYEITFDDCREVIDSTPKNITQDMLDRFERYRTSKY